MKIPPRALQSKAGAAHPCDLEVCSGYADVVPSREGSDSAVIFFLFLCVIADFGIHTLVSTH